MFGPCGRRSGDGGMNMALTANVARVEVRFGEKTICEREGQASTHAYHNAESLRPLGVLATWH
jgi:hypothetical protein